MKPEKEKAILKAYQIINQPMKAGPKWATYERPSINEVLQLLKKALG